MSVIPQERHSAENAESVETTDTAASGVSGEVAWSADRAFELFEKRTNLERGGTPHLRHYRLERMDAILKRIGSPHLNLPAIHIAGSKGKGSTAAFSAALLATAGYTTGLYTSPHVTDYRERYTILAPGGLAIPDSDAERLLERESRVVWDLLDVMKRERIPEDELPTTFELLTALAFRFFAAGACDFVVLETGLGGRLDATNLCRPILTMITRIELEHREYLGNTLEEIAREKGGIIKPGVPVIIAPQRRSVRAVLDNIARTQGAPVLPMSALRRTHRLSLSMRGTVQRTNAGQALAAYSALRATGRVDSVELERLHHALERTRLPGRGELLQDLFLDGAHTPESVAYVVRALPTRCAVAILGVVGGKDLAGIVGALHGNVSHVIVSQPGTFKPGDPAAVLAQVKAGGIPAELHLDPREALDRAREINAAYSTKHGSRRSPPVLVTGSFYMVGEIRRLAIAELSPCR